jgi:hypothetical protein
MWLESVTDNRVLDSSTVEKAGSEVSQKSARPFDRAQGRLSGTPIRGQSRNWMDLCFRETCATRHYTT